MPRSWTIPWNRQYLLWGPLVPKKRVSFIVINLHTQKKQNKIWKNRTYVSAELQTQKTSTIDDPSIKRRSIDGHLEDFRSHLSSEFSVKNDGRAERPVDQSRIVFHFRCLTLRIILENLRKQSFIQKQLTCRTARRSTFVDPKLAVYMVDQQRTPSTVHRWGLVLLVRERTRDLVLPPKWTLLSTN